MLKILLAILASIGIGYAFGRYVQPAKIQFQEKEVIKTVEVVKRNTVVETHEVKKPDGTIVTDTKITDHDVISNQSNENKEVKETISNEKPQWKLRGMAGLSLESVTPIYGVGIERRIIGPVFVGAWGLSNSNEKIAGISIGIEF
jgi:hypothetical protein